MEERVRRAMCATSPGHQRRHRQDDVLSQVQKPSDIGA
jgi:hypothetical protein